MEIEKINEKGQIFSLDFVLSLVAVILAVAIIWQANELVFYDLKESQLQQELFFTAENAANIILSSPKSSCQLTNISGDPIKGYYMSNCIDIQKTLLEIPDKGFIGVPDGINCRIEVSATIPSLRTPVSGCTESIPSDARNVVKVSRKTMLFVRGSLQGLPKDDFQACFQGNCSSLTNFYEGDLNIAVWKD